MKYSASQSRAVLSWGLTGGTAQSALAEAQVRLKCPGRADPGRAHEHYINPNTPGETQSNA